MMDEPCLPGGGGGAGSLLANFVPLSGESNRALTRTKTIARVVTKSCGVGCALALGQLLLL
jgi:hypothetical protein